MSDEITYGYLVDMVEHQYFRNVDEKNLDGVLDCFNKDAVFTIQSSGTVHEGRDDGIKEMFENLFDNYDRTIHRHFHHIADPPNSRIASQFTVDFWEPGEDTYYYTNCNFWYLEDGKFQEVYVYMSDENVLV